MPDELEGLSSLAGVQPTAEHVEELSNYKKLELRKSTELEQKVLDLEIKLELQQRQLDDVSGSLQYILEHLPHPKAEEGEGTAT